MPLPATVNVASSDQAKAASFWMQFQELSFAHYSVNLDEAGLIIDTALQTAAYSA
jgi:hypothetical protein